MKYISILFLIFSLPFLSYSQQQYVLENLGEKVNSKYEETNPLISADGQTLFFVRKDHPSNTFGPIDTGDIWYSEKDENGNWKEAQRLQEPFNQNRFNGVFGISPDGNTLIIKGTFKNGKYDGVGLSIVERKKKGWSQPKQLNIQDYEKMSLGYYDGAFLCNDGKTILLYLSEKKGDKNCDLYVTFKQENGNWTKPLNLGKTINTRYLEASPFLASDGITLYFSSMREGGHGNADIYVSKRLDDTWTKWSPPQNLGPSINTKNRETYYTIAASGEYAFIVQSPGQFGKSDIVKVKVEEAKRPDPVVLVYGKVLNAITHEPIDANITHENLITGSTAGTATSNPESGEYKIVLSKGKKYGFRASAENYVGVSENLDLSAQQEYQEVKKDLYLIPKEKGQAIRLNNIFFESAKSELQPESFPELERLTTFLKKEKSMQIEIAGHTDNTGEVETNQKLSEDRAMAVRNYLLKKGIPETRVSSKGYGESKPIGDNSTEEGKALNRRVEFIILKN